MGLVVVPSCDTGVLLVLAASPGTFKNTRTLTCVVVYKDLYKEMREPPNPISSMCKIAYYERKLYHHLLCIVYSNSNSVNQRGIVEHSFLKGRAMSSNIRCCIAHVPACGPCFSDLRLYRCYSFTRICINSTSDKQ